MIICLPGTLEVSPIEIHVRIVLLGEGLQPILLRGVILRRFEKDLYRSERLVNRADSIIPGRTNHTI